jgi:hypothetical protein
MNSEMIFTSRLNCVSQIPAEPELAATATPENMTDFSSKPSKPTMFQYVFSFPAMLGGLLVVAVFVMVRDFAVDPDLWWHLKVGQSILATHRWPTTDPYSFTAAGQPWLAYEWLGDVLIALAAQVGGLRGLQALLIILGACIMLALYSYATLRCGNSKAGFLATAVLLFLATINFNLRPQMLGYLFLILTLIALERFRQSKPAAVWFLPAIFLAWINTHGSWEIGLGTILIYWLCGLRQFRLGDLEAHTWKPSERVHLSLIFLLCLAVVPITPYGTRLAAFPFQVGLSHPLAMVHIQEWQSISLNAFSPKLLLALVLGTIALQIAFNFKWRVEDFLLLIGATAMAFIHVRFVLIFVPIFAPAFACMLARWVPGYEREKDPYLVNAILMVVMLVVMIRYFPSRSRIEENVSARFPVSAVNYLNEHTIPERLFNSYGFGGYLVYSRGNEHKVFIDGRSELYEDGGVFADYLYISGIGPGSLSVLRNYGIRACLINREDPLAVFLAALPEWKSVYADQVSVIFVRGDDRGISSALPQ